MLYLIRGMTLVMCAAMLAACGGETDVSEADVDATALAVTLAPVERQVLALDVVASGQVAAWEDMPLGVEVSGLRVREVAVDVGRKVQAGDVLLTLDDRAARSDVAQSEAAVAEAQAGLGLAEANLRRGAALRERKLISAAEYDQLQAAGAQARARLGSARAARDAATLRLSYTVLKAPDAGTISRRAIQPGEIAQAGTALLGLIRQDRLEWRAHIDENDLHAVAPGQSVRLRGPDGLLVEARVRAVAPGLETGTRTALLQADIGMPGRLRAGMVVEGHIDTGETQALTVPLAAVVRRDGYAYAFTVDAQGTVARHRVEVGRIAGERIEILSGLDEATRVVTRGAGFLGEGDHVRVVVNETATTP